MEEPQFDPPPKEPFDSEESQTKTSRFGSFMKSSLAKGYALGEEQMLKGKKQIEHGLGLGHQPNVIPTSEAIVKGDLRTMDIGWHPVAGFGGKWFAEKTSLGQAITKHVGKYPDPTQHWAVLVGDYVHQLWMDEHLDVIYINEKIKRDEWHTFEVGKTRFNDEALRQTGEMVIHNMRTARPGYNLISNNCQNFAMKMLDATQIGAHREFATTFAIYQRATGKGAIEDLFTEPPDEHAEHNQPPEQLHQATMDYAHQVMDENTTKLDCHDHVH